MPVDKLIQPMGTKSVVPSGPHTAWVEAILMRRTEAMVWRCCGNAIQWMHPSPYDHTGATIETPYASITTLDSWTNFTKTYAPDTMTFALPYRMSEGFERIMGIVTMCTEITARLQVRLVVETLINSIATTNGDPSLPGYATEPSRMMHWSWVQAGIGQKFSRIARVVYVTPTEVASGPPAQMCLVRPQVKIYEEDYGVFGISSHAARVFLQGFDLCDCPAASVGL